MKYLKNISKFNEVYMKGGDGPSGSKHIYTDTQKGISQLQPSESHLNFLDRFINDLTKMRDEINRDGFAKDYQINYIEELYQLHHKNYD